MRTITLPLLLRAWPIWMLRAAKSRDGPIRLNGAASSLPVLVSNMLLVYLNLISPP